MAIIGFRNVPVKKIFVDANDEKIFICDEANPRGRREPHTNGKGYQRDPWSRVKWIDARVPIFSHDLFRPLEVSERADGTYAGIDGGGRWVMAQKCNIDKVTCRVHTGLSRKQEALLFSALDSEMYKLRSIDNFLAQLTGGEHMAMEIAAAVKPYPIAVRGSGTLKAVGALTHMYQAFAPDTAKGVKLIQTVAKIASRGWSGFVPNGKTVGRQIDGKFLLALAMVIEVAGPRLSSATLIRVLERNPINALAKKIEEEFGGGLKANAFAVLTAKHIASLYNRSFNGEPNNKVSKTDIDNCSLLETIQEGRTYSALVREARMNISEDDVADEDDSSDDE